MIEENLNNITEEADIPCWEVKYGNGDLENVKFFSTKEAAQKFVNSWANFDRTITKMQGPTFIHKSDSSKIE